jgi:hypothetical protein
MKKGKNKIKVGEIIGFNPNASINEIVRHMRRGEMELINYKIEKIRSVISAVFYMARGDILHDTSEGLKHILDNTLYEIDELRRDVNGETEGEEERRIRKEREAA